MNKKNQIKLIKFNPSSINAMYQSNFTESDYKKMISANWRVIKYIDKENMTDLLIQKAVKNSIKALKYVKLESRHDDMVIDAIKSHPFAFPVAAIDINNMSTKLLEAIAASTFSEIIPYNERCLRICEIIINAFPNRLALVPEHLRTKEIVDVAIRKHAMVKFIPEAMISETFCIKLINDYSYKLFDIPIKHRSRNVCLAAIDTLDNMCAKYIPESVFDQGLVNRMVDTYATAEQIFGNLHIDCIPTEFMSTDVVNTILKVKPTAIPHIPVDKLTRQHCIAAAKISTGMLRYVPDKFRNVDFYREILSDDYKHARMITHIDPKLRTYADYETAVHGKLSIIGMVPQEMLHRYDDKLIKYAIAKDVCTLEHVEVPSVEILELAVLLEPVKALSMIDSELLSDEVLTIAITRNTDIVRFIPVDRIKALGFSELVNRTHEWMKPFKSRYDGKLLSDLCGSQINHKPLSNSPYGAMGKH